MKLIAAGLITLSLGLGAVAAPLFTPCSTEDSTLCYWDANTRSNGKGISFIAYTDELYVVVPTSK